MNTLVKWTLLAGLVALLIRILNDLDINKVVISHQPGPCFPVGDLNTGSEDIVLLSTGRAIISSGMYPLSPRRVAAKPGALYTYDLSASQSSHEKPASLEKFKLIGYPDVDFFYPLGLGVWEKGPSDVLLYVINSYKHDVEVFSLDVEKLTATYKRSLRDPAFNNINSLVLVGEDKFYVTNFLKNTEVFFTTIELALKLPLGSVVYYDGKAGKVVASGLKGPNGIDISKDRKKLYIAMNMLEEMHTYKIDGDDQSIKHLSSMPLNTSPDNLFVDADGAVWTGAQPVIYRMVLYMFDSEKYAAPSQVLKIVYDSDGIHGQSITEVYGDCGKELQGSTSAVRYGDKLMIGTLFHKLMICTLSHH